MRLYEKPAHVLHDMLAKKEITAVELTQDVLARMDETEGQVQAYRTVTRESALAQAEAVDKKSREIEEGSVHHMGSWYERFYNGAVGEEGYREKMQEIRDYFKNRPAVMERLIEKYDGT